MAVLSAGMLPLPKRNAVTFLRYALLRTDAADNLVLKHLRALCADISDVKSDVRDMKARFGSIESYVTILHGDQARISSKLDKIAQFERLEEPTA